MLISSTPPSKPACKLKLLLKVICTASGPSLKKMLGDWSRLSLMVLGSLTNAAFGGNPQEVKDLPNSRSSKGPRPGRLHLWLFTPEEAEAASRCRRSQ